MVGAMKGETDKTLFCDYLGYTPNTKILELLIEGRNEEYTFNQIIQILGVNKQIAYRVLKFYLAKKFIVKSKKVRHIQLYKLNKQDKKVRSMINLFDRLLN